MLGKLKKMLLSKLEHWGQLRREKRKREGKENRRGKRKRKEEKGKRLQVQCVWNVVSYSSLFADATCPFISPFRLS